MSSGGFASRAQSAADRNAAAGNASQGYCQSSQVRLLLFVSDLADRLSGYRRWPAVPGRKVIHESLNPSGQFHVDKKWLFFLVFLWWKNRYY